MPNPFHERAMVAMSGGVDSAVCALLMKEAGYDVTGVTMQLFRDGELRPTCDGSETDDENPSTDVLDARAIAKRLGLPHLVCHLESTFCRFVVDEFVQAYLNGETPNPCVTCNKTIKFGALAAFADKHDLSVIATGHYARVEQTPDGLFCIKRAKDATKDQSYMLWSLSQDVLSRVRFPLGDLTKQQVREIAAAHGFSNAQRRDSQDICFVPNGDYVDFIRRYAAHTPTPGYFVDADGNRLGEHKGMLHYTIGQRKGLGIALGQPMYVCRKDAATGCVTLGKNDDLFSRHLTAREAHWLSGKLPADKMRVEAKIRYAHTPATASVWQEDDFHVRVEFDTPQRAIAKGQSVVFYDGDTLLGGGVIE